LPGVRGAGQPCSRRLRHTQVRFDVYRAGSSEQTRAGAGTCTRLKSHDRLRWPAARADAAHQRRPPSPCPRPGVARRGRRHRRRRAGCRWRLGRGAGEGEVGKVAVGLLVSGRRRLGEDGEHVAPRVEHHLPRTRPAASRPCVLSMPPVCMAPVASPPQRLRIRPRACALRSSRLDAPGNTRGRVPPRSFRSPSSVSRGVLAPSPPHDLAHTHALAAHAGGGL
jgi:hypothetical protein